MVDELLKLGTDGGPPRYTEWLEALEAVYEAAGEKRHEAGWVVDAGYIGRTIQTFTDRLKGHRNKPQLTYTIFEHCQKILRKSPGRFVMPKCLRWVRRRPLPIRPAAIRCRHPPARCSYILVSAVTIDELAKQFGLTADQVVNEFESYALCARTLLPQAAHPSAPRHAACRRAASATARAGANMVAAGCYTAAS
jgi:hypothetical protein